MKSRRQDIQCLRGIAIISVVFYHLYPTIFANGYLGVDMFFVISGYLMARNLTSSKIESFGDVLKFYYSRFKRILPTYYLVCFFTVVCLHYYFCDFWWETNYRYSLASLFCITNQLIIHDSADYFREFLADGTSLNAFIHFWSLGVEVQFYLLVPFIFYGLQFLKYDFLKLVACFLMTIFIFVGYFVTNQQFAFNFMFLRLWQFSAGFTALFLTRVNMFEQFEKQENEKMKKKLISHQEDVVCIALAVLALCFHPIKIDHQLLRPVITATTAFLLYIKDSNNKVLTSNSLTYIGNLSYVIYLVHWPVITMCGGAALKARILCIVATLIISICVHHIYEKQYLTQKMLIVIPLILSLIVMNGMLQYTIRNASLWKYQYPDEVTDIVERNKAFLPFYWVTTPRSVECENTMFDDAEHNVKLNYGYCKYPKGNGTLNVLVIGNSFVLNFGEDVRRTFVNNNYSTFETMPIGEGFGIYADSAQSTTSLGIFKRYVEKTKPDILFIISRYSISAKQPFENKATDLFIDQFNENIRFYEQFVKYIFILGPHPLYNLNFANYFMQYLIQRPDEIENLHLSKKEADNEMMYIKERFKGIKCRKCEVFDLGHRFVEAEKKYLNFDRETRLSYVDNSIHFTSAGMDVVRPVFQNITDTILKVF